MAEMAQKSKIKENFRTQWISGKVPHFAKKIS